MPVNGFSTGKDVSLVIQTATGPLNVNHGITDFNSKQITTKLHHKGLGGETKHGKIYDSWSGTFKIDRFNPILDNYFAGDEAAYYAGLNQLAGTIYETNAEADGSLTQWRYTGVILNFDDAGDKSGDKKTVQSISFDASRRIKVA